jgi:hypothetical protein
LPPQDIDEQQIRIIIRGLEWLPVQGECGHYPLPRVLPDTLMAYLRGAANLFGHGPGVLRSLNISTLL